MYWDRMRLKWNAGWLANRPKDRLLILWFLGRICGSRGWCSGLEAAGVADSLGALRRAC